jgi:LmbE family N-acetylglucosaminyl deacetylase
MIDMLEGRVVIISPHLDDAVLSLGSAIAGAARRGARVEVLTVFGGDPLSQAPAGPWDRRSGFATEGEAARVRRHEDLEACATLGASARWLTFGDEQYERRGDEEQIGAAVGDAVAGSDAVLIPGWPLANADHASLTQMMLRRRLDCGRLALYVEQPYSCHHSVAPSEYLAVPLRSTLRNVPLWHRIPTGVVDERLKHQAVRAYRSQLRQLGLGFLGRRQMLRHERSRGGEAVAWVQNKAVQRAR